MSQAKVSRTNLATLFLLGTSVMSSALFYVAQQKVDVLRQQQARTMSTAVSLATVAVRQQTKINTYEKIIVNCLNGDSVLVDAVDRPCRFGNYIDGREKF